MARDTSRNRSVLHSRQSRGAESLDKKNLPAPGKNSIVVVYVEAQTTARSLTRRNVDSGGESIASILARIMFFTERSV